MRVVFSLLFLAGAFAQTKLPPPASKKIDFVVDVQPILAQKCYSCHGEEAQQSGLRLDRRQAALRGGDYGPVINPGDSEHSKLIRRVANGDGGLQMPPTGPLSEEEIGILRAWIDQGADYRIQVEQEPPPQRIDPNLSRLVTVVRSKDSKAAEKLLSANPDLVKAHDASGATLLHHAAGFGDVATMKLLLDKGADPNAVNKRKATAIFWALHDEAKVRLLIARGAAVNVKSIDGRSPLYQAAAMGDPIRVVRLLLEKGAAPNAKTLTGMTPLMAASRASVETMHELIDKGADVNARNAAGSSALIDAAGTGTPEAVSTLR